MSRPQRKPRPAQPVQAQGPSPAIAEFGRFAWRRDGGVCAGLVLVTILAFWPVGGNDFVSYDDDGYVVSNEFVNGGLSLDGLRWALTATHEANWHPLTWISHMVDCQLFKLNPAGHHLMNLGLHALNGALLYLVLFKMTKAVWPSAVVAALFTVHPLHVESVAWLAERKDVLSTLFGLAALLCWLAYLARPGLGRYLAVAACYTASLMSKPMLVTLPFLLLLLDYWPLERIPARGRDRFDTATVLRLVMEKMPLLGLSAASCVITLYAQSAGHAVVPLTQHSVVARLATSVRAYGDYLVQTVVPVGLAPIYPLPKSISWPAVAASAVALVALTALALRGARRWRHLAIGWFWYLGLLVPVIGLVHVGSQARADRYTYLPLVGVFIAVVWSAARIAVAWPWSRRPLAVVTAVVLAVCCLLTNLQVRRWASTEVLFTHTCAVTRDNAVGLTNLGLVAIHKRQYDLAESYLREALRIDANAIDALGNLAVLHRSRKEYSDAIATYQKILVRIPNLPKAILQIAQIYQEMGDLVEAERWLQLASQLEPARPSHYFGLGSIRQNLGKTGEALRDYETYLRFRPGNTPARNNIAWIHATCPDARFRDGPKAVALLEPMLHSPECDANLLDSLAAAYAESGRFEAAIQTADQAILRAEDEKNPPELIAEMRGRADLYRRGQPYRELPRKKLR